MSLMAGQWDVTSEWSWVYTTCLMAFKQLSSSQLTAGVTSVEQLSSSQLTAGVTSVGLSVHYLSDGIQAALKLPTDCRCDLSGAECSLAVWWHSGSSQAPNWLQVWPQWSWVYTTCLMAFKQLSSSQLTVGVTSVELSVHYPSDGIQAALKLPTDCRCDLSGAECTLPVWWHSAALKLPTDCRCDLSGAECALPVWGHSGSSQAPNWLEVWPQWSWVYTTCLMAFKQLSSSQLTTGVTSVGLSAHYLSEGIQAALKLPTDCRCDLSGAEWTLPVWWHSAALKLPTDCRCDLSGAECALPVWGHSGSSQAPNWLQVWPQWSWVYTTCLRAFRQLSSSQLTAGVTSVELSVHYLSDGIQAALKLPTDCRCDLSGVECALPVGWHSGTSQAPIWLQMWPQWSWVCTTCLRAFRHLSSSHLTADCCGSLKPTDDAHRDWFIITDRFADSCNGHQCFQWWKSSVYMVSIRWINLTMKIEERPHSN